MHFPNLKITIYINLQITFPRIFTSISFQFKNICQLMSIIFIRKPNEHKILLGNLMNRRCGIDTTKQGPVRKKGKLQNG